MPTLSNGELVTPLGTIRQLRGEELTATISCHSESPWTPPSSATPLLLKDVTPKSQRTRLKWKSSQTTVQYIMIITFLKSPEQSRFSPQVPGQVPSQGLHNHRGLYLFLFLNSGALQSVTRYPAGLRQLCKHVGITAETSLEGPTVQESSGVLVTNEQLLVLCGSNERYKLS